MIAALSLGLRSRPRFLRIFLVIPFFFHNDILLRVVVVVVCRSAHMTVDIFRTLKASFEEPDPGRAVSAGCDGGAQAVSGAEAARELLLSLPGVNTHNLATILGHVNSVAELCVMPLAQMEQVMGPVNAKKLHQFVNQRC